MNSEFSTSLLRWFGVHARPLPWRETRDPYAIWLSEIILQQTRVEQGRDYWQRFLRRFPSVEALAAASEDEVLRLWQGLGYYSRARNLHAAARQVVALGHFPDTVEGLRALPGVGDYTAAAVASMAFGVPAAAVDGNVYRVLSRHFGISTAINTTEGHRLFAALAAELLPPRQAGTFNQALMDFGATLCTPRTPRCTECPVAETCVALREGRVEELPVKLVRHTTQVRRIKYIFIRCSGYVAIHRRADDDIWRGLWEPYVAEDDGKKTAEPAASGTSDPTSGLLSSSVLLAHDVRHVLTHRVILADLYLADTAERPSLPSDYLWVPESSLDDYAKSRLVERLLALVPKV